jgi:hypothetical protein
MSGCHTPFITGIKRVSLSALLKVCSLSYQQFGHLIEEQKDGNWCRIIVHLVTSLIFSVHSARRKGWVPPEFQVSFVCLPNSILASTFTVAFACCWCVFSKLTYTARLSCFAFQFSSCSVCILLTRICAIVTRRNYILLRMTLLASFTRLSSVVLQMGIYTPHSPVCQQKIHKISLISWATFTLIY